MPPPELTFASSVNESRVNADFTLPLNSKGSRSTSCSANSILPSSFKRRKHLAGGRHAFLHQIVAVCQRVTQSFVPGILIGVPADGNSMAAVVVVWFKDQLVSVGSDIFNQVDFFAEVIGFLVPHDSGPRHVFPNSFPLFSRKQIRAPLIRQDGE